MSWKHENHPINMSFILSLLGLKKSCTWEFIITFSDPYVLSTDTLKPSASCFIEVYYFSMRQS